jgi:hypothetical protein
MSSLVTFPGRFGDLIWALPTVRAISETFEEPVALQLSVGLDSITPLLQRQPYIDSILVDTGWLTQDTAPITPRTPPVTAEGYDRVFHLGYDGWPGAPLPIDIYRRAAAQEALQAIDLDRPWIGAPYHLPPMDVAVGFTDEHFELKYGLCWLLQNRFGRSHKIANLSTSPRWLQEGKQLGMDWLSAAAWLSTTQVFLGCCSALHVLACAVGCPVILMEPAEARWADVFYPYGKAGPQVTLVLGNDGRPTWDARHLAEAIERVRRVPTAEAQVSAR